MASVVTRRSLVETWDIFESLQLEPPRDPSGKPFILVRMPSYDDDEPLVLSFFRTGLSDMSLSNLTLPRTFFGRSLFERADFSGSDLSESRMCWNDFVECDLSATDLSRCDLRASIFRNCKFQAPNLTGADLRSARFEGCDFTDAVLAEAKVTRLQGFRIALSPHQKTLVSWHWLDGRLPGGG